MVSTINDNNNTFGPSEGVGVNPTRAVDPISDYHSRHKYKKKPSSNPTIATWSPPLPHTSYITITTPTTPQAKHIPTRSRHLICYYTHSHSYECLSTHNLWPTTHTTRNITVIITDVLLREIDKTDQSVYLITKPDQFLFLKYSYIMIGPWDSDNVSDWFSKIDESIVF